MCEVLERMFMNLRSSLKLAKGKLLNFSEPQFLLWWYGDNIAESS